MAATPTIDEVIAAIPAWAGRPSRTSRSPAGLTNANYRVDGRRRRPTSCGSPGRRPSCSRSIGRTSATTRVAAATTGVSPRVVEVIEAWDVFVLEWVDARTMSNEALRRARDAGPDRRDAAPPPRRAAVPRRLRHVPAHRALSRARRRARHRRSRTATASSCRPSRGSRPRSPSIRSRPSPCHNDLLAENYLDDGERLWIVDYEYSGNNDPTFELGNTCQELGYDDAQVARAVRGVLRRGDRRPARPDAAPDDHVRRRLDAVGGDPGPHLDDRLRLHRAGPRSAGRGRRRRSTGPTSRAGSPWPRLTAVRG